MKNATLSTIATILTNVDFEGKDEILAEVNKDLHRGDAVKAEKAQAYDTAWPIVRETLSACENGATVAEIFESIGEIALTKGQLSYALNHQWADRVVKTAGKVNTYALKA